MSKKTGLIKKFSRMISKHPRAFKHFQQSVHKPVGKQQGAPFLGVLKIDHLPIICSNMLGNVCVVRARCRYYIQDVR